MPMNQAQYAAHLLGKLGGSVTSKLKARAARRNGKLGGYRKTKKYLERQNKNIDEEVY